MKQSVNIILASGSPRRKEMFERMGLQFTIIKSEGEEVITDTNPSDVVESLSLQKAKEVAGRYFEYEWALDSQYDKTIVIGADTVVASDNEILGKPENEEDALSMLMALSGKEHQVLTGVSVICLDKEGKEIIEDSICFVEETKVCMYPFSKEEAMEYVKTKEPMDKAGAYGIQGIGAFLVEKIIGDYNTVVGFPLSAFIRLGCQKKFFRI